MTRQSDHEVITAQAGDVDRELTIEIGNGAQHTVQTISQSYPTTIDDLWDACIDPARLERWFAPVSGHLAVGGRYQIEGNASGEVTACEPLRLFAVTWDSGDDVSNLTVRLADLDNRARLTIEHSHTAAVNSAFWSQYGPGATGVGWDLSLLGLALHLLAGSQRPIDENAFTQTMAGQQFIRDASRAWGRASESAGTLEAEAAAAADRTTAAYLGLSPE